MSDSKFNVGGRLAPDGDMTRMFVFYGEHQLEEGVVYKVVSDTDLYFWNKYDMSDVVETHSMSKFMSEGMKMASQHNKARNAEVQGYQKKMSMFGKKG